MRVLLAELARVCGGRLIGNGQVEIRGAATLADAAAGHVTLVDHADKLARLAASAASAAVIPRGFPTDTLSMPAIEVDDVHRAFTAIVTHFRPPRPVRRIGISPLAAVSPTARLAADVDVHPLATIGDDVEIGAGSTIHAGVHIMAGCRIAENVTIYPGAVLYEDTAIGPRSIVHAGAVIGAHGFGYRMAGDHYEPSAQLGYVEIGSNVEIGANTTIDRGTYGRTTIGDGTKIDNQVMIAHNCHIGRHNLICSQVGIAGSTTTGDRVVMAGQVGVRDHIRIGEGAVLGAMAGVSHDVAPGVHVLGIPATPERQQKVQMAAISKLPEMRKELKELRRRLEELLSGKGRSAA
jgi:UDP-3-O-[3-hydroxymyristoyl] glucosamine N-acyltransferase